MAAECLVTTFGPITLDNPALTANAAPAAASTGDNEVRRTSERILERSPRRPHGLRVCATNLYGSWSVPVGVQLFDARDTRAARAEEVVWLAPGEGRCLRPRMSAPARLGVRERRTPVIAAVSVKADEAGRSPLVLSAEPDGPQFVGLLLPAIQAAREAGGGGSGTPPDPPEPV
jgi:hypothetical protein